MWHFSLHSFSPLPVLFVVNVANWMHLLVQCQLVARVSSVTQHPFKWFTACNFTLYTRFHLTSVWKLVESSLLNCSSCLRWREQLVTHMQVQCVVWASPLLTHCRQWVRRPSDSLTLVWDKWHIRVNQHSRFRTLGMLLVSPRAPNHRRESIGALEWSAHVVAKEITVSANK